MVKQAAKIRSQMGDISQDGATVGDILKYAIVSRDQAGVQDKVQFKDRL